MTSITMMKRDAKGPTTFNKQAILTTATDGHTHLLLIGEDPRDRSTPNPSFEGLSTPGGSDGHQHPWVMDMRTGRVMIGEAEGHAHRAAAVSATPGQVRAANRARERGEARDALTQMSIDAQRRGDDAVKLATLERTFAKEKALLAEIEETKTMTKQTTPADVHKQHTEAGTLLDDVIEKHRAEGEPYHKAATRLGFERSEAGDEYRKVANLADKLHREAQAAATNPGDNQRFQITKRYADNTCLVAINKSRAEVELETVAKGIMRDEGCDYYTAYARAMEQNPGTAAKAVFG